MLAKKGQHHPQTQSPVPMLAYATVQGMIEGLFILTKAQGTLRGRKAASCLLQPEPGDQVLVAHDAAGCCHILAVLERAAPERFANLAFQGDVRLVSTQGAVTIAAQDKLTLASEEFVLHATRGQARVEEMRFESRACEAKLGLLRVVANTCEQVFADLTQRLKSCFRFVEGHEEAQLGSARQLVENTLTVQCKNSIHTAEETVKIDAETIHLA